MRTEDILAALRRLKVETGSLACLGCGREHDCGVHGCRIMREAAELIEKLTDRCARYAEEIAVLQARQKWIPVTERLPELEEKFEDGGGMSKVVLGIVENDFGYPPPNPCFVVYLSGGLWMLRGEPVTVTHWMPLPEAPEVQPPEGHADPIGALGCLPFCPVCGSWDMQWDPETDVSTCKQCGYQNAEEARRNQEKREKNGEVQDGNR